MTFVYSRLALNWFPYRAWFSAALCLAVSSLLLLSPRCEAQWNLDGAVARPIPGAGHDYIHMLNEIVNPANGALSLRIALPVPKSRGLTLPFAITYDSGDAHVASSVVAGQGGIDVNPPSNRAQAGHGWSDTIPYATATFLTANVWTELSGQPANAGSCPVSTFYNFYDAAGSSHNLGLAAIGAYTAYNVSEQPNPPQCQQASITGPGTGSQPYYRSSSSGGDDLVSGSMDNCNGTPTEPNDCGDGAPSFTVEDSNNTVYSFPANSSSAAGNVIMFPSQIEDRNGNILRFNTTSPTNPRLPITDTLGRTLVSTTAGSSGVTQYAVGGLSYSVGYTSVSANFTTPTSNSGCFKPQTSESYNAIGSITLPNGQAYNFTYDSNGMVNKITYPDGGWVQYTWGMSPEPEAELIFNQSTSGGPVYCLVEYPTLVITGRTVGYTAGTTALTQSFSYSTAWPNTTGPYWTSKQTVVKTTDNITGKQSQTTYNYAPVFVSQSVVNAPGGYSAQAAVETSVQYADSGNLLETVNKTWADMYQMTGQQTVFPNGVSSEVVQCFQSNNTIYVQEKDEYDFLVTAPALSTSPSCGSPAPTRKTIYGGYIAPNFPCQTTVYGNTGARVAETDISLDGGSGPCGQGSAQTQAATVPSGTHDETNYGPSSTRGRGNPTTVARWLNTGGLVQTTARYDETGQVVSITDSCGNASCGDLSGSNHTTTYSYADSPSGGNPAGNSNAYLTQITDPLGHTQRFSYSYTTGELANATDENSQTTSYVYSDLLNRLTQTNFPDGGKTLIAYNDSTPSITTSDYLNSSTAKTSIAVMDGVGHVTQTQLTSDPYGTDYVDTSFDGLGRVYTVSNPHRSGSLATDGTTSFTYDALGRKTLQTQPDGSTQAWAYTGNANTFRDEAGNQWMRYTDGLGRLTKVFEPNGSSTSPSLETDYAYDPLDDLISASQLGAAGSTARTRSFSYDSLGRLQTANNPETGSTTYTYDANSNVVSKTDALNIAVNFTYDALNRMVTKKSTYGGDTNFTYTYDTGTNGVGRLASESNPTLEGTQWTYDVMGRISGTQWFNYAAAAWQTGFSAVYDFLGNMTQQTYPDGRIVTNVYDGAARQVAVLDKTSASSPLTYLGGGSNGVVYGPSGAVTLNAYGNGVSQQFTQNNRLQTCRSLAISSALPAKSGYGNVLDRTLLYSSSSSPCGNTPSNNGNIAAIVDNLIAQNTQGFTYDTLNRLTGGSQQMGWYNQTYNYDSFGNMIPHDNIYANPSYSVDASTNRLAMNGTLTSGNLQYDADGRVSNGPFPGGAIHSYTYTPEGYLRCIDSCNQTGSYLTNGIGQRTLAVHVPLNSDNEYVYLNGQMMADVDQNGVWTDYIYANGQKIARVQSQKPILDLHGVRDSSINMAAGVEGPVSGVPNGIAGYVIKPGDRMMMTVKQTLPTYGGLALIFTNGTGTGSLNDIATGTPFYSNGITDGAWHALVGDLTPFAGLTLSYVLGGIHNATPAGTFDLYITDAVLQTAAGPTLAILTGQSASVPAFTGTAGGAHNMSSGVSNTPVAYPANTNFYIADQIGSAQVELSGGGWPTWQGEFTPFGQEIVNGQTLLAGGADSTTMRYKFTGKERDTESGLDYFGARYYGSTIGRFTSPDSAADEVLSVPIPFADLKNPQSLNLYSYVGNNPLSRTDPDGHDYTICATGQQCVHLTDQQYYDAIHGQGNNGINAPAFGQSGNITCGGAVCGTASYMDQGAVVDLSGGQLMGVAGGKACGAAFGLIGEVVGRLFGSTATEAAGEGAKVLLQAGTKQAAKDVLDGLADSAQKATLKRSIARATTKEAVSIKQLADGSFEVVKTRPGFDGSQSFTTTIGKDGSSVTVQTAVDSTGAQVHYDPK